MLPKMAFTGFAARFREPKLSEGFADVTTVDFEVRKTSIFRPIFQSSSCDLHAYTFCNSSRAPKSIGNYGQSIGYEYASVTTHHSLRAHIFRKENNACDIRCTRIG
jgi:hypothetical protein